MRINETGWSDSRTGKPHATAALVAGVISVLVHVVGIVCVSGVEFGVANLSIGSPAKSSTMSLKVLNILKKDDAQSRPPVWEKIESDYSFSLSREMESLGLNSDRALIDPPTIKEKLVKKIKGIIKPTALPKRSDWRPRQQILQVEEKIVSDEIKMLPRTVIPRVERIKDLKLEATPLDMDKVSHGLVASAPAYSSPGVDVEKMTEKAKRATGQETTASAVRESPEESVKEIFNEKAREITPMRPVEDLLIAQVTTYGSKRDKKYGYFRIEIERAGAEILPVIPKDIILIQDSSASIAERRLYFCREGMTRCLEEIEDRDRFNIISFSDTPKMCFDKWSVKDKARIEKARSFIAGMKSGGNTDIFAGIKNLAGIERVSGRPVIVLLVTDGFSNTGQTRSSNIVGDFSNLNRGEISVFTIGTVDASNSYLLDLLSSSNGGDALIVTSGRWDIPAAIHARMKEISRPVLANLSFIFTESSQCEVYPVMTGHLYLDRPFVLHGRYKKGSERIVFQAIGKAGDVMCDMVFDVPLKKSVDSKDKDIQSEWARQKVYHLIAEYTRNPKVETLKEIKKTAHNYRIKIPYEGKF